jgi:hypothetical protein
MTSVDQELSNSHLEAGECDTKEPRGSMTTMPSVETMLQQALSAVLSGDQALREALDDLPAAIYVTDPGSLSVPP